MPPGSYHSCSAPSPILETKEKERLLVPTVPTRVWPLADVAGRPQGAAKRLPAPPAVPVQPPSRSWRRPRSGACARWAGLARSHFRQRWWKRVRQSLLAAAAGQLRTRAGAHERPREAGSAGRPERQGGGGRRREQASISSVAPGAALKAAPTGLPARPAWRRGVAVPGCRTIGEGGAEAGFFRPGNLELRVPELPRHLR